MMILNTFWRFRYLYQTSKQFDIGLTTHLPLASPVPKVVFVRCLRTWTAEKWLWEASPRRRCLTASQLNMKLWWLRRQRLFLLFFFGGGPVKMGNQWEITEITISWLNETPSTGSSLDKESLSLAHARVPFSVRLPCCTTCLVLPQYLGSTGCVESGGEVLL